VAVHSTPAAPDSARHGAGGQTRALAVPSRFWLSGVISAHRDTALIRTLAERVRVCGYHDRLVLWGRPERAITHTFRERVLTGKRGRPRATIPLACCWLLTAVVLLL